LETDLLHKLQARECEARDARETVNEVEEKLRMKTEAIEKAHKVIQAMQGEAQEATRIINRLEEERERLRDECKQAGKHIKDVGKRVQ
jgi:methyl-accepting chemotaxis protein